MKICCNGQANQAHALSAARCSDSVWQGCGRLPLLALVAMLTLFGGASVANAQTPGCPADLDESGAVGVPDLLELLACWGPVAVGTPCASADLTGEGNVGVPDLLDLLAAWGDCPEPPAECGDDGTGSCCEANGSAYCDDAECCEAVCGEDPFCCENAWDNLCAEAAADICVICFGCGSTGAGSCCEINGTPYCDDSECCEAVCAEDPFCCEEEWDSLCAEAAQEICENCPACGNENAGGCCDANDTPYCDDSECCEAVCAEDPFCCEDEWDKLCAEDALEICTVCLSCGSTDAGYCCEANGTPYCNDVNCCSQVCASDPFCCDETWDDLCAEAANDSCLLCNLTSCTTFCGTNNGACHCDAACIEFGDCCGNACIECGLAGCDNSCNSSCGGHAGNCWCDSSCYEYNDCCEDSCLWCDQWYCD